MVEIHSTFRFGTNQVHIAAFILLSKFLREFGGWALSSDDWLREMVKMVASLDGREDAKYNKVFYTVGYDSPCE